MSNRITFDEKVAQATDPVDRQQLILEVLGTCGKLAEMNGTDVLHELVEWTLSPECKPGTPAFGVLADAHSTYTQAVTFNAGISL